MLCDFATLSTAPGCVHQSGHDLRYCYVDRRAVIEKHDILIAMSGHATVATAEHRARTGSGGGYPSDLLDDRIGAGRSESLGILAGRLDALASETSAGL